MTLGLSVTFTFLAPTQHPIEQADFTAFALRRVAIAYEWTCPNRAGQWHSVQGFAQDDWLARRDRSTQFGQVLHRGILYLKPDKAVSGFLGDTNGMQML